MRNLVFILITFTWAGFRAEKIQDGSSTAKKGTSSHKANKHNI